MKLDLYKFGLNFLAKHSPSWNLFSEDCSVVTAADSNVFPGLLSLFFSLKDKIRFVCCDLGLSSAEREYCNSIGMEFKSIDFPPILKN